MISTQTQKGCKDQKRLSDTNTVNGPSKKKETCDVNNEQENETEDRWREMGGGDLQDFISGNEDISTIDRAG